MKLLDILNEIKIIPPIITDWESIFKLVQTYNPNLSLKEIQHSLIAYRLLDQTDLPPDNPAWSWIIPSMDTPETNPEYSQGYMIKVFFDFDYVFYDGHTVHSYLIAYFPNLKTPHRKYSDEKLNKYIIKGDPPIPKNKIPDYVTYINFKDLNEIKIVSPNSIFGIPIIEWWNKGIRQPWGYIDWIPSYIVNYLNDLHRTKQLNLSTYIGYRVDHYPILDEDLLIIYFDIPSSDGLVYEMIFVKRPSDISSNDLDNWRIYGLEVVSDRVLDYALITK
jgi:hypothetical protein